MQWELHDTKTGRLLGFSSSSEANGAAKFARDYVRRWGKIDFGAFPFGLDEPPSPQAEQKPKCPEGFKWNDEALRCEPDKGKRAKSPKIPKSRKYHIPISFVVKKKGKGNGNNDMTMMPSNGGNSNGMNGGGMSDARRVINKIVRGESPSRAISDVLEQRQFATFTIPMGDLDRLANAVGGLDELEKRFGFTSTGDPASDHARVTIPDVMKADAFEKLLQDEEVPYQEFEVSDVDAFDMSTRREGKHVRGSKREFLDPGPGGVELSFNTPPGENTNGFAVDVEIRLDEAGLPNDVEAELGDAIRVRTKDAFADAVLKLVEDEFGVEGVFV